MNVNNVGFITGRLVRDIEIMTKGERKFAFLNLAVQRNYKNKESGEYDTDFLSFVLNEKQAEFVAKHFAKGDVISIAYELRSSSKENEEGKKITTESKVVTEVSFVPGAKRNSAPAENAGAPAQADFADISDDDDDLPF